MLLLTLLSAVISPELNRYSQEEIDYAHEYAAQMLAVMDQMAAEGEILEGRSDQKFDYYSNGEEKFDGLKHAALFLKGEMAEDFVYALQLAEDWCRYSTEAALRPTQDNPAKMATARYNQARAELRALMVKQYRLKPPAELAGNAYQGVDCYVQGP